MDDIGCALFGDDLVSKPSYVESTRHRGLRSSLEYLYHHGYVQDANSADPWFERFKVTRLGRDGAIGLAEQWGFARVDRLEPKEEELVRIVNRLSEGRAEDHAWIDPVDLDRIIAELGWTEGEDLIWEMVRELDNFRGSGPLAAGAVDARRAISATYEGLARETRRDARLPFQELFEALLEGRIAYAVPDDERDFAFVIDTRLRQVLVADDVEAPRSLNARAHKASALLLAGVIEGMLLDALQRPDVAVRPGFAAVAAGLPQASRLLKNSPAAANLP